MNIQFDTLKYFRRLEQAGVTKKHAEAHADSFRDFARDHFFTKEDFRVGLAEFKTDLKSELRTEFRQEFATKEDLKVLESELEKKMAQMEGGLETKIVEATSQIKTELKAKISTSKFDLVKWVAASMVTLLLSQFGIALTLIKFLAP